MEFEEGNNRLEAVGSEAGIPQARDSMTVRYTYRLSEQPDRIELSSETLPNGSILVTATVLDRNGWRCHDYGKRIYFSLVGDGEALAGYGTPTRSSVIEMANGRAAIECRVDPAGKAVIEARNQDFRGTYLVLSK